MLIIMLRRIVNKGDYPYTLEKIRDGREIVAVKHHKKLSEWYD